MGPGAFSKPRPLTLGKTGADFSDGELGAAKIIAKGLQAASPERLEALAADGTIKEICNGKDEK